jgi:hypothetical protein
MMFVSKITPTPNVSKKIRLHKVRTMRKRVLAFMLFIFILSFVTELALEHFRKVDNLGLWYTLIVASVYTLIVSTFAGVIAMVSSFLRKKIT